MKSEKNCKICKELIRASNIISHEKICGTSKGKRKRLGGFCEECGSFWEHIKGHKRKGCLGKPKVIVKKGICKFCSNEISKSNLKRHEEACKKRKKKKKKEWNYRRWKNENTEQ